jgi:exodeoxyribonuclease VII large subunit
MLNQQLANAEQRLSQIWRLAESLHPEKPLKRGYVLVTDRHGAVIGDAAKAHLAKALTLRFANGDVPVRVEPEPRPAYNRSKPEQPSLL